VAKVEAKNKAFLFISIPVIFVFGLYHIVTTKSDEIWEAACDVTLSRPRFFFGQHKLPFIGCEDDDVGDKNEESKLKLLYCEIQFVGIYMYDICDSRNSNEWWLYKFKL